MSRFRDHDDELLYFGTFCRLEADVSAKKLILCNEKEELHNKIYYVKQICIIEEEYIYTNMFHMFSIRMKLFTSDYCQRNNK